MERFGAPILRRISQWTAAQNPAPYYEIDERNCPLRCIEQIGGAIEARIEPWMRGAIRLGQGTRRAHEFVRCYVAPLDDDRPMGVEYERLAAAIRAGELARAVEAAR